MRIFLFLSLSLLVWGCSTVEVTKEVIKVTNTVTDKVKDAIPNNKSAEDTIVEDILEENAIEEEIEIIEEKQEQEKSIVENQQKSAEINFIGKTENNILNVMGTAQLSRIDGSVYTLRNTSPDPRLRYTLVKICFVRNEQKVLAYIFLRAKWVNIFHTPYA